MKVLLVQPFKDTGLGTESYPPVGLGYIAFSLLKSGHLVKIVDCLKDVRDYASFIKAIEEFSPDFIGINLFSISSGYVLKMVNIIKEKFPKIIVILGGPHVSSLPEQILNYFKKSDFAIRGEGEVPIRKLVDSFETGEKNFSEIPGLIYREGDKIVINEPYFSKNVEEYGFPAWDLIKPTDYFRFISMSHESVPVFFSRGCPFPCTFCAAKVTSGQTLRRRGFDHIFEELYFLKEKYNIKRFIIEDEGFSISKNFIMEFCERVKKENFKAKFFMGVGMRLNIIDKELLEAMEESNFEKDIALGIESGSERILNLMKKKTNLKMIWDKVNLMNEMKFFPNGYFIIGYPDETRDEIKATVKLAMSLPIREASFTAFQPLPATEATRMLIANKELPENFDFATLSPNKIAYAPKGMTKEELERIRKIAILRFYLKPRNLLRCFRSMSTFIFSVKKIFTVFFKKNIIKNSLDKNN